MRPRLPAPLWEQVRRAYSGPGRAYHGVAHLDDVLARYDEVHWEHPLEALIALAYHDAVYIPGASDNEERSASLARAAIERWVPGVDVDRVVHEIELTARHGWIEPRDVGADEARGLGCDMAILGASPDAFDAYERGIAEEYGALPTAMFAIGRRAFLERLLSRERIYLSHEFQARFDASARANLRRSLELLRRAPPCD